MAFFPTGGGGLFSQGAFQIDPNMTPDQLQRRREMLASMMPQYGRARYVGEGLGHLATGIMQGRQMRNLEKAEGRERSRISDLFGGLTRGGTATEGAPILGPQPYQPKDPNSPEGIAGDAMTALGKRSPYADAIASVESAGSGDYSAVGPETGKGRAYGRYQVMDFNIGPWTEKYLGKRMTPEEFLASPQAQDAVFNGEFGSYVQKYGNPQDAASMWFSGRPMAAAGNASDGYNTVPQYVEKFTNAMGGERVMPAGGGMDIGTLAEIASSPYADPGQKMLAQTLLQQQLQTMDPKSVLELENMRLQNEAMKNPAKKDDRTTDMKEYDRAVLEYVQRGEPVPTFTDWTRGNKASGATTVNNVVNPAVPGVPPDEEELRKKLGGKEGESWAAAIDAGTVSSGTLQDMQLLDEIIKMAPQGPIVGRLANAFPGVSSAADAFNSVVKRVAPTLRAPGSGSTSDIEYDGMLKSLPQLSARPEANTAIAAMMKAKAQINIERADAVRAYQNGEISATEARKKISEIDKRSIMTPELNAILRGLAPDDGGAAPEGIEQDVWDAMPPEDRALWQN
jgi:hypothetical protein